MTGRERAGVALGTLLGAGYFPLGPGTLGSALAVLMCVALGPVWRMGPVPLWRDGLLLLAGAALLYAPACWAAGVCEQVFSQKDPGRVVIDEVVGQMITLAAVPGQLTWGGWKYWLAGLIIFRVFDIAKPFPIRRLERLPGGFGVVTDDVAAGFYGYVVLKAAQFLGF